jgi:histidyl-tRNA synthetase
MAGDDEIKADIVTVRNMTSGQQQKVPFGNLKEYLILELSKDSL